MRIDDFNDDEVKMAKADLYKISKLSIKIFKSLHEGQNMEAWVQAKITKAADYIASVYHFIDYEMKITDYGEQLENSDIYSESVKAAFQQRLMEAKQQLVDAVAPLNETTYDTFKHPKYGRIEWINYQGVNMIVKIEPNKPLQMYAMGDQHDIADKWKKMKAELNQFESYEHFFAESFKPWSSPKPKAKAKPKLTDKVEKKMVKPPKKIGK
jgi:hypothetical protein